LGIILFFFSNGRNRFVLDNFLKPVIDGLDESNTIENESQICSIYIKRNKVNDKSKEGVIIGLEHEKVI